MNNKNTPIVSLLLLAALFFTFNVPVEKLGKNETIACFDAPRFFGNGMKLVDTRPSNLLLQSTDAGATWQDISQGLPVAEQPETFFVSGSDLYLSMKNELYHSKGNLKTPVWEKEKQSLVQGSWIASNTNRTITHKVDGKVYRRKSTDGTWSMLLANFNNPTIRTIYEAKDGTVFIGCDDGLYKSANNGRDWKHVVKGGWVLDLEEAGGVLLGTSQQGIMRSTDHGESWECVINDGGVGIGVEQIAGGFAAISYSTKTKSRRIRISMDKGKTWTAIDEGLRPAMSISSIKQVGKYLLVGHPDGIFRSADRGKTWELVYSNFNNPFETFPGDDGTVFRLHTVDGVVYAVPGNGGC